MSKTLPSGPGVLRTLSTFAAIAVVLGLAIEPSLSASTGDDDASIAAVAVATNDGGPHDGVDPVTGADDPLEHLLSEQPGVAVSRDELGAVVRLYGGTFGNGPSVEAACRQFIDQYANIWGVRADELIAAGPSPQAPHITPLMFDRQTGRHKFIAMHFAHQRDGVPVFGKRLTLLARNQPGYPLVLASAELRSIGDLKIAEQRPQIDLDAIAPALRHVLGVGAELSDHRHVIWAGADGRQGEPKLAITFISRHFGPGGYQKWLNIIDATTHRILHRENQVHNAEVRGTVSAMAADGIGAAVCNETIATPLAYARVTVDGVETFADVEGQFVTKTESVEDAEVEASIRGRWFRVVNEAGEDVAQSQSVIPPEEIDFVFDAAEADVPEHTQAAIEAYVHANLVRDFVLDVNPAYPVIGSDEEFRIHVNIDSNCNAYYDGESINFFTSGAGCNNTAFDTVVYHEYGHHLVNVGGSGQGQYGEGMSDCIAVLMTDDPVLGRGFSVCGFGNRNADNDRQYPCFGGSHSCGQLISGCVWSLRNELAATEPDVFRDILADLTINSILLHTGSRITPQITIDFLTLDDDNGNIFDGTPHFDEIMNAFLDHNMDPQLPLADFAFPDGVPAYVDPIDGHTLLVEIGPDNGQPVAGTGVLHFHDGEQFVALPMTQVRSDQYEAQLPPVECPDDATFYFTVETTLDYTQHFPPAGSAAPLRVFGADSYDVVFADDFEADTGWSVHSDKSLTGGAWERGDPIANGDRSDPTVDGDGSGQCYLTSNEWGNSDVDDGATTLTSPALDATDATVLTYWRWYANAGGSAPQQDVLLVEVSDDDGASWSLLEQVGPTGADVFGGWVFKSFDLRVLSQTGFERNDEFRLRFIASDTDPQSLVEAGVDGVQLLDIRCHGKCAGDFTGDGKVDVSDLLWVINNWGLDIGATGRELPDENTIDVTVLLEVINNWGADCAG